MQCTHGARGLSQLRYVCSAHTGCRLPCGAASTPCIALGEQCPRGWSPPTPTPPPPAPSSLQLIQRSLRSAGHRQDACRRSADCAVTSDPRRGVTQVGMDWFTTRLWLGTMACRLWTMASSSVGGWRTLLQPCHGTYTMPCPCSLLFMYLHSCPSHQLGQIGRASCRERVFLTV